MGGLLSARAWAAGASRGAGDEAPEAFGAPAAVVALRGGGLDGAAAKRKRGCAPSDSDSEEGEPEERLLHTPRR